MVFLQWGHWGDLIKTNILFTRKFSPEHSEWDKALQIFIIESQASKNAVFYFTSDWVFFAFTKLWGKFLCKVISLFRFSKSTPLNCCLHWHEPVIRFVQTQGKQRKDMIFAKIIWGSIYIFKKKLTCFKNTFSLSEV